MTFAHILNGIAAAIANIGWIVFIVMLLVDALLWRIHPVLGMLGALFIFAILFGIITI